MIPDLMKNYQLDDKCFFKLETDWVACQVDHKRKPIDNKLFGFLHNRSVDRKYTDSLKVEIKANQNKYRTNLSSAMSQADLKQLLREYLGEESAIIRKWYVDMARAWLDLEKESKSHQETKNEHALAKDRLDQRKLDFSQTGEIDTPIGTIKLGFHDLISLLPFLVLCILTVLINSTCRQLILRSTFQANGPKDETTHEALSLTMSIWLEPFRSRIYNAVLLIVLVVLAIIALFGLWQIVTNPGLEVAEVNLNDGFIIACTMLAGIVFALRYMRLLAIVYR